MEDVVIERWLPWTFSAVLMAAPAVWGYYLLP